MALLNQLTLGAMIGLCDSNERGIFCTDGMIMDGEMNEKKKEKWKSVGRMME